MYINKAIKANRAGRISQAGKDQSEICYNGGMQAKKKLIDTSPELYLYRFGAGVKLVPPEQVKRNLDSQLGQGTGYTIDNLSEMPVNIAFCDINHRIQYANTAAANLMGFSSSQEIRGQSSCKILTTEANQNVFQNREIVLRNNILQIVEEDFMLRMNKAPIRRLTVRCPWYDSQNKLIGIFNNSITLGKQPLAIALSFIVKITPLYSSQAILPVSLTPRENQISYYIMRGKTAKLIAKALHISPRTVETHIENIKNKFNVHTRAALIERLFNFIGGHT